MQYDWCPHKKRTFEETDRGKRDTGKRPSISQRKRPGIDLSFTVIKRNQACRHLDFRFLGSEIVRQ